MAITSFPFVDQPTTRQQYSDLFNEFASGVAGDPWDAPLQVTANSTGMNVQVAAGKAIVRGHMIDLSSAETLDIEAASSQPRIDTVVVRLTPADDAVTLAVIKGAPATSPVAPGVTQTSTGIFELPLANVRVEASAVTIAGSNVTDRRTFVGERLRTWTTATRPTGAQRRLYTIGLNITTSRIEYWSGTSWSGIPVDASTVVGTLTASNIPNLPASKIASGVLDVERIPDVPASKVTGNVNAHTISGNRIFVQSGTPSGASTNDIWIRAV